MVFSSSAMTLLIFLLLPWQLRIRTASAQSTGLDYHKGLGLSRPLTFQGQFGIIAQLK
jgi:hypothetical protein